MYPTKLRLTLLFLLPLAAAAQSAPPSTSTPNTDSPAAVPAEAARELATKKEELSTVTQQITNLQIQAEGNETVKAAKDEFRDALRTEMVKVAPDLQAAIDRQAALVAELTADSAAKPEEETTAQATDPQTKLEEYRALHQKLAPIEQSVQAVPAVQRARGEYYDKLIAEMQRIEPRTQELLAKHRELVAIIRELSSQPQSG